MINEVVTINCATPVSDKLPIPPASEGKIAKASAGEAIPQFLKDVPKSERGKNDKKAVDLGKAQAAVVNCDKFTKVADETTKALADKIAAQKAAKSKGRVAKMLAKKNGETNKMPLSGKDALAAIKSDERQRQDKKAVAEVKMAVGAPVKTKADVDREARKGTPKQSRPTKRGVGSVAKEAILAGKTNEQALVAVMKVFPGCKSNIGCMNWYRNDLRKRGKLSSPTKTTADK